MLLQEEERSKKLKDFFIHLTIYEGSSNKDKLGRKGKKIDKAHMKVLQGKIQREKMSLLYQNWSFQKKKSICFESNLIKVSNNT